MTVGSCQRMRHLQRQPGHQEKKIRQLTFFLPNPDFSIFQSLGPHSPFQCRVLTWKNEALQKQKNRKELDADVDTMKGEDDGCGEMQCNDIFRADHLSSY